MSSLISRLITFLVQTTFYIKAVLNRNVNWINLNYFNFKANGVNIGSIAYINGVIYIENKGKINIGNNFQANSGKYYNPIGGDTVLRLICHTKDSEIIIGNNVGISNSTIVCWCKVEICDNVMIGGSVKIWDTNFHSLDPVIRASNDCNVKVAAIKICENAFIGSGSLIMKGVTIGRNSIIAAGSIVINDIPDNVIAAGNPCKVIKRLIH